MDEVSLTINSQRHSLWWTVDQEGYLVAILAQHHWDKAAQKFFHKLIKKSTYIPRTIVT